MPDSVKEETLREITDSLVVDVSLIEELQITAEQISVFFPIDRMKWGLGEEIIVFVEGLFNYPQRTYEVRAGMAMAICRILKDYFPDALLVECFVTMFNPCEGGFYSIREGENRGD
ncbi:MAG: hypothetical protein Q8N55_01550 [bacterium]|nr:hypothetical protein [bacterium]